MSSIQGSTQSSTARKFVTYEDVCRQSAHNKAEMESIQAELDVPDISYPRRQYLESGLVRLTKERLYLTNKEKRIRKFNTEGYLFIQ